MPIAFCWFGSYRWFPSIPRLQSSGRRQSSAGIARGFRAYWRWRSHNRVGRPRVSAELRKLIGEMSWANPYGQKIHPSPVTPPLDDNNAEARPVARDIEWAPHDECPYPEGTTGRCPSLGDFAQRENVRRIRSGPVVGSAHRREPPCKAHHFTRERGQKPRRARELRAWIYVSVTAVMILVVTAGFLWWTW